MGRKCVVRGCLAKNVPLHCFPDKCAQPKRYLAWVKFVQARRQDGWSRSSKMRTWICSEHFTPNCFIPFSHQLTKSAVPTINPWNWELDGDDDEASSLQNAKSSAQVELLEKTASRSTRAQCTQADVIPTVQTSTSRHNEGSQYIGCVTKLVQPAGILTPRGEHTEQSNIDPRLYTDSEEQMEQQIEKQNENDNDTNTEGGYGLHCSNAACISKHKQLEAKVNDLEVEVWLLRRQLAQFSSKSAIDADQSERNALRCYRTAQTSESMTMNCNISTPTGISSLHREQTAAVYDTCNSDEARNGTPSAVDAGGTRITEGLVAVIPSLIGASSAIISGITISTTFERPSKRCRMLSQSDVKVTQDAAVADTQCDVLINEAVDGNTQRLVQCEGKCIDKPVGINCRLLAVPDSSSPTVSLVNTANNEIVSRQDSGFNCQPIKSEDAQDSSEDSNSPQQTNMEHGSPTIDLTSKQQTKARFANLTEAELDTLLNGKLSKNSKNLIKSAMATLDEYARSKGMNIDELNQLASDAFDKFLGRFFAEARKQDGSLYATKSLLSLRYGIAQHFKKTRGINIMTSKDFGSSREIFAAALTQLKQAGKGAVMHKKPLTTDDFNKLYSSNILNTSNPKGLQNKVFVDLMIQLCNRGRENLREMTRDDFIVQTDPAGHRYVSMKDEQTKNHRANSEISQSGRMYETPGSERCPVASLEKYMAKLNPECPAFWQRPKQDPPTGQHCWYDNVPVGRHTLFDKMKILSKTAQLSCEYTNLCLRATCIAALDQCGYEARHIMPVSGQKCEASIRTYSRNVTDVKKRDMSLTLSSQPPTQLS